MQFRLDIDKAVEASLFILNRVDGCDFHKLFKLLYFAEAGHLAEYGRPITGDDYIAMQNGPVPSFIYDVLKFVRGDKKYLQVNRNLNTEFEVVDDYYIGAKRQADTEYLSASDIEYLEKSITENRELGFFALTDKSHDTAWQKAAQDSEMKAIDIAQAAGANTEMLKYIEANIANVNFLR